jgi:hypothetical protein
MLILKNVNLILVKKATKKSFRQKLPKQISIEPQA